ncbi:MAG: hypothetical protein OCC45_08370 [Desulfotalea sp.]
MNFIVDGSLQTIQIGLTGLKEIAQNIRTICSTVKGTVPLDRSFGIDVDILDLPLPVAQAKLRAEIVQEVEKQEPRVKVLEVSFKVDEPGAMDGKLIPIIKIQIKDGVEI